jgi:tripartite-type tricarboxylate transporter receptor subunit TctC
MGMGTSQRSPAEEKCPNRLIVRGCSAFKPPKAAWQPGACALPGWRRGGLRPRRGLARLRRAVDVDDRPAGAVRAGAAWEEWSGLVLPAGASTAAADLLAATVAGALREPEVRQRYALLGAEPVGSTPREFADFLAQARLEVGRLVREVGIEVN